MMTGFLRDFADAEEALGNVTGAAALRALSQTMANAINAKLWALPGTVRSLSPFQGVFGLTAFD